MSKLEVTIAIPSIKTLAECRIIESFLASGCSERLFVQFVFLHNPMVVENLPSHREVHDTHELLFVGNQVFILSCEENFFRLQDFADLLKPMLLIVGEHDIIHWERLIEALAFARDRQLDAVGLTFLSTQHHASGAVSQLLSTPEIEDHDFHANQYARLMIHGRVFDSRIAFPAWLSYYGTIYAICYIGNHLFSRETFAMLMQYRSTEPMHSFVYMQAAFFAAHSRRYGYFHQPVVERTGSEMERGHKGENIDAGFQLSRLIFGHTRVQQIVHVAHLNMIEDDALFHLLVNSIGVKIQYVEPDSQGWGRHYMLAEILFWCLDVLNVGMAGRSFCFPELSRQGSLLDIRHAQRILLRIVKGFVECPAVYASLAEETKLRLIEGVERLAHYLDGPAAGVGPLRQCCDLISGAITAVTYPALIAMNKASFAHYAEGVPDRASLPVKQEEAA